MINNLDLSSDYELIGKQVGMLGTNCYFLKYLPGNTALIIDPASGRDVEERLIKEQGGKLQYILNTHGHWDHTASTGALQRLTGAEYCIHADDVYLLTEPCPYPMKAEAGKPDRLLAAGDSLPFGNDTILVLHTPGHTEGSVCFLFKNLLFCGDTLFAGSIGRTDLPGGSYEKIMESIKSTLLLLPDDTVILPGHGPSSTMGRERKVNPYLR